MKMLFLILVFVLAVSSQVSNAQERGADGGTYLPIKKQQQQLAPSKADKKADIRRGPEADAKKIRTGQVAQPKDMENPDYCVSQAVKQDRRRVFTASELKHYAKGYEYRNEAFFVEERDGTLTLVDPLISQERR